LTRAPGASALGAPARPRVTLKIPKGLLKKGGVTDFTMTSIQRR
jgi:hypothetical protein